MKRLKKWPTGVCGEKKQENRGLNFVNQRLLMKKSENKTFHPAFVLTGKISRRIVEASLLKGELSK